MILNPLPVPERRLTMSHSTPIRLLRGFTLIELLIVVAIIAILAAIAVPNFLEAQVRAKVTRVKADMRTLVVALESYSVDNNRYVREWRSDLYNDPLVGGRATFSMPWVGLSTPVAYTTSIFIQDPFFSEGGLGPNDAFQQYVRYYDLRTRPSVAIRDWYGDYRLLSFGPNRDFFNRPPSGTDLSSMLYDPTNGTISAGNIWRSPKNDMIQPPTTSGIMPAH